jgi:hypothetical protein
MINEFRRARRRKVSSTVPVSDMMTERVVGRIGNISEKGMLLIASESLLEDALYQFSFQLPGARGQEAPLEIGAHLLWLDRASAPGQAWTGFRFIGLTEQHVQRLRAWIESPGGHYE